MKKTLAVILILFSVLVPLAQATDLTSSNFIVREPVNLIGGGRSTSNSFQLISSVGQLIGGQNASSAFIVRSGVLYYPSASSPILAATAGNGRVNLSWSAAVGVLANITNYQLGTATISGGPYTYESVGNVAAFSKTGLNNGTTYYFKIKSLANNEVLSLSAEAAATPVAPPPAEEPPPAGGGGGGGGSVSTPAPTTTAATKITFKGSAYPNSHVVLLKDAQIVSEITADQDAKFETTINGLSGGNYVFSVYSEDQYGMRSALQAFPLAVTSGATTIVMGVFVPPTIGLDKDLVIKGDDLALFGQAAPASEILVSIHSDEEEIALARADDNGFYKYSYDTSPLEFGDHAAKSKQSINGELSGYSKAVAFKVGTVEDKKKEVEDKQLESKADFNQDSRINLVEFSIAAYWYKRPNPPKFIDMNGDNKVDLFDFSILAYYWTG